VWTNLEKKKTGGGGGTQNKTQIHDGQPTPDHETVCGGEEGLAGLAGKTGAGEEKRRQGRSQLSGYLVEKSRKLKDCEC